MKNLFTIFILLITAAAVPAQIITGGVEYSEASARNEMLEAEPLKPDTNLVKGNLIDGNNYVNRLNILKGHTDLKDRTLGAFSDGSYGIIYKDNPVYIWYYNNDGVLINSEIKTSLNYPYKTYKYTPKGKLVNMSLRISERESFVFETNGKLIAHWLGNNCYDSNQNIIMTRKIRE